VVPEVAGSSPVDRPFLELPVTTLDAILLGAVQGLTEFLPISSSGHLMLAQHFLGMKNLEHYIIFDLVCHLGTLLAIFVIFFQNITTVFQNKLKLWQIILGTLPLFPLVLLMKPIKATYSDPTYLGFFFLLTAGILFAGILFGKKASTAQKKQHPWRDPLVIGLWQAAAILPGVSRSGSTISGAKILGWNASDATTFSFLLAIPAILGGTTLEIYKIWFHPESTLSLPFSHYLAGFLTSFLVGLFALQLLIKLVLQNKFYYFAWYCLILGLATTFYFL
jgi:undecaprenyl-diphosphatase